VIAHWSQISQKIWVNPQTDQPWKTDELFWIACEVIDPVTGEQLRDRRCLSAVVDR
jgi:hypothetical protein